MIWFILGALTGIALASSGSDSSSSRRLSSGAAPRQLPSGASGGRGGRQDVVDAEFEEITASSTQAERAALEAKYRSLESLRFTKPEAWFRELAKSPQLHAMAMENLRREKELGAMWEQVKGPGKPKPGPSAQAKPHTRPWEALANEIEAVEKRVHDPQLRDEIIDTLKRGYMEGQA